MIRKRLQLKDSWKINVNNVSSSWNTRPVFHLLHLRCTFDPRPFGWSCSHWNVEMWTSAAFHLDHPLPSLTTPYPTPHPTQLRINGPRPQQQPTPITISHSKPHPNPQEAPAHMNRLLCIWNTWHPPFKKMEEPFDPRSILCYNHQLHLSTCQTYIKTGLFYRCLIA